VAAIEAITKDSIMHRRDVKTLVNDKKKWRKKWWSYMRYGIKFCMTLLFNSFIRIHKYRQKNYSSS
jgi:hypothetical protein